MSDVIGRFHVRKRLGGGGFGEVFLAEDPSIGRQVAIKVFRPKDENLIAFATSSNTEGLDILRTRFLNEAKILAQLENAVHVVNVLEYGELPDGAPYYVMPYLPHSLADELGKDVFDLKALEELPADQRPRALPLERVLTISEQLLKGLAAAHAKGLVHRDIKPANVMLTEDGDVRIVDFGIAKAPDTQHSTVSHLGMGSRNYMAPEQRESAKHVDARADVYAVGRVLYRMLTGKLPVGRFADPNVAVPALGKAMNDVILAAISEDREARPADAAALLARFQQARAGVGQQDSSAHSGTWAGEQGSSGLRDELKPLKARIIALVSEQGFLSEDAIGSLRALAAIADLDEPGLVSLIETTLKADKALSAKSKLGGLIGQAVKARGSALDERTLQTFHAAGEAVGWDAAHLQAVMQAALTDHSSEVPTVKHPQSPQGARPAPAANAGTPPMPGRPSPSSGNSTGTDRKSSEQARPETDGTLRRRLPMALAALLVLGGAGWGLVEWRHSQVQAEQRERALSAARESDAAAWQQATEADSAEAYGNYLKLWPQGSHAAEARTRQAQREEQSRLAQLSDAQRETERIKTIQRDLNALGYRVAENGEADTRTTEVIKQFEQQQKLAVTGVADEPLAQALRDALEKRELDAWADATRADSEAAYTKYRTDYPSGRHVGEVDTRIAEAKRKQAAQQEAARLAEEKRKADEARRAEETRLADERRRADEATARAGGFEDLGNGSLRDTRTGLVWTQSDNGRDIDWNGASAHCQAKGMRLPTIDDLQAIYERPGAGTTSCGQWTCKVSPLFRLTRPVFWSGTKEGSSLAFAIGLSDGDRVTIDLDGSSGLLRALCVGRS